MLESKWFMAPLLAALLVAIGPSALADETEEADDSVAAEVASEEEASADEPADSHDEADHEEHGDDAAHHGADEHHDEAGHGESSGPDPLTTDPDLAVWTAIVFFIMLALLTQVAWKPIMEGLQAREEGITGKLADADRMHAEAKTMLSEHEAKLAGAAEEVRALLEEARRDADTTLAKAKADAKAEFEAERQRATRDIEQAADAAVRQLAERTAGLAIDLAGRVVKQDITPGRQSEIVQEALGRFAGNDPSAN